MRSGLAVFGKQYPCSNYGATISWLWSGRESAIRFLYVESWPLIYNNFHVRDDLYECFFITVCCKVAETVMASLLFVTTVGQPHGESAVTRKQIRKQAMSRAAAKRRTRGGYGQVNKLQYPMSVVQRDANDQSHAQKNVHAGHASTPVRVVRSPSCTGYEQLRIRYGVDLLDLSALTNFHVSQGTVTSLSQAPSLLRHIVRSRQWSYLDYLPRGTAASVALDRASQCVAARLHEFLYCPSEPTSSAVLRLYASALQALQAEIEDSSVCLSPATLCATQLLGLYEASRRK